MSNFFFLLKTYALIYLPIRREDEQGLFQERGFLHHTARQGRLFRHTHNK